MIYNDVIDTQFTATGTEPLTLAQVKSHLKITYTDDDTYLTELITECREALQKFSGVALIDGSVTAIINNGCGKQELPYGPVQEIVTVKDKDGIELDPANYMLRGIQFKYVEKPLCDFLEFEYTVGYTSMPADILRALKEEIAYRYEHRGDDVENKGISLKACDLIGRHKRNTWFL